MLQKYGISLWYKASGSWYNAFCQKNVDINIREKMWDTWHFMTRCHNWMRSVWWMTLSQDEFFSLVFNLIPEKKHVTSSQCWFKVEPPSQTVPQHWNNIGSISRVSWDGLYRPGLEHSCSYHIILSQNTEKTNQCWAIVGPTSAMLAQH